MEINLKNKIALVTGGSGQLGRAICRTLAECGADVAVHYFRNEMKAREIVSNLKIKGVRVMAIQADITNAGDVQKMRNAVETELGAPDIIINNAVIQYPWKSVMEQDLADYESQFRSCVLHNVLMIKTFVPAMMNKKWGRVIAINTECAMQNAPHQSAYVSGKRGMDGVLRVLAREIGESQITVNQIAPGWMISEQSPDDRDAQKGYWMSVPMRRRGHDQDVANLAAFLASDLAGFISGQYISVSGGNVMPAI